MADYSLRFTGQDNLSGTIGKVKKEISDLGKETTKLEEIDKKFGEIANSSKALNTKVRQTGKLLAEMKFEGGYSARQFLDIARAAGEAKDTIGDTQAVMKFFADDRRWLNFTVQGFQALAGAGNVAAGALSLFGVEQEKVNQAIMQCQAWLSILNGIKSVAILLDKEGYIQTGLKVLGLQAEAAAETEVTAATEAATTAQIKNNLAVLANPYVAAAVAIAALVGGIIYWVSTMDDANEEQEKLNGAVDAFTDAATSQTGTLTKQITAFESLKKVYNESGGRADILTKKILNNKEAQKQAGITLKTLDDVHRMFRDNSTNYIAATTARANAFVAEQAAAAFLGKTLDQLSKVYNKLMKGEEVDWKDIVAPLEKLFGKDKARELVETAGGKQMWDWLFSNLKVPEDQVADFMLKLDTLVQEEFFKTGPGKILADFQQKMMEQAEGASIDFSDLLSNNEKELNKSTGSKGGKGGTNTKSKIEEKKKQVVGLINLWEELIRVDKEALNSATTEEALKAAQTKLENDTKAYNEFKYRLNIEVDPKIKEEEKAAEDLAKKLDGLAKKGIALSERDQHKFDITSSYERATGANKYDPKELSGIKARMDANDKMIESYRELEEEYKRLGVTGGEELDKITQKILELLAANDMLGASARQLIKDQDDKEKADEEEKKRTEEKQKLYEDLMSTAQSLGSIFQATGDEGAAAAIQVAMATTDAIKEIIPQVLKLIGVKQGEAMAEGAASAAGLPFPANLGAIASIIASIMAVFATIASVAGSFASGGIVGGGTYYGDHILARVNAGEMILNRKQQSNLFRAIESGGIGSGSTVMIPDLRIKGSDLYVSFRNYSKSVSKTGKTTGIL